MYPYPDFSIILVYSNFQIEWDHFKLGAPLFFWTYTFYENKSHIFTILKEYNIFLAY